MHRTRPLILALAACLGLSGVAGAQGPLGPDVISTPNLTLPQRRQIDEYIRRYQDDLLAADPVACQQARKRLTDPLTKAAVSLAFRRAYGDGLMNFLPQGARSNDEHVAANALLLAGHLATTESVDVLEDSFADERVPVRYAAIAGATLVFAQINDNAPAIPEDRVIRLVTNLAGRVRDEPNRLVLDGAVRSLVAGANQARYDAAQTTSLTALPQALTVRLRAMRGPADAQTLESMLRAADALRAVLIKDIGNTRSDIADQASLFSGHLLAYLAERLGDGDLNPNGDGAEAGRARQAATQILDVAETTVSLVNADYKRRPALDAWNLAGTLEGGDGARVAATIRDQIIGPGGVLVSPPFFAPGTFDR